MFKGKESIMSQNTMLKSKRSFSQTLRDYFQIDKRQAIIKKEIIGGISTFLAMVYILAVNPAIVGDAPIDPSIINGPSAVMYSGGLFLATALSAMIGSILMGIFANIPIALAPGMGLNAFFAYNVAKNIGFESALSVTIISGFFYFFLAISPLRQKISELIPNNFKLAIGAAIGLFIAYLGMQNAGIVQKDVALVSKLGDFTNPLVILAICILFLGLILHYLKVPGGILITMVVGAIILVSMVAGNVVVPETFDGKKGLDALLGSYNDFSSFKDVARAGWVGFANVEMWKSPITYFSIFSFLYMDFFDTTGTLVSLNKMIDLDKNDSKWFSKANYVDASATVIGGAIGATTVTSFVESTVGVGAGAKTGIASIITGTLFAIAIAAWPIIQVFLPINNFELVEGKVTLVSSFQPITGPILMIIGTLMITQLRHFDWKITIDIPMMFLTLIFMTLTNSIGEGMAFGAISYVLLNAAAGTKELIVGKYHAKHPKKSDEANIEKSGVNEIELQFGDNSNLCEVKVDYFKRINWVMILISSLALIFIIVQTLITAGVIK